MPPENRSNEGNFSAIFMCGSKWIAGTKVTFFISKFFYFNEIDFFVLNIFVI